MKHLKSFKIFESTYKDILECMQVLMDEYEFTHSTNSMFSDKLYNIDKTGLELELSSVIKKMKSMCVNFVIELESMNGDYIQLEQADENIISTLKNFFTEYDVYFVAFHIK